MFCVGTSGSIVGIVLGVMLARRALQHELQHAKQTPVLLANPMGTNAANPTLLWRAIDDGFLDPDCKKSGFVVTMSTHLVLNATPTKLTKSPARRRVLSDLYGRLTVATEREPSGEDVASTEQGTDATGETGGERGSQRRARAPLKVACRPPRRSEDRPKVIQLLTPVSAARLADDFAGLPSSTLSGPW